VGADKGIIDKVRENCTMSLTIDAVFDGEVFRPQEHLNLPTHMHYIITIDVSDATLKRNSESTGKSHASLEWSPVDDQDSPSWRIYNDKLRAILEPKHNGKLVAIHIETGDFEVARSSPQAWKALRKRQPAGQIDVIDIGPVAVDNPLSLRADGLLTRRNN